jgi:hypothetical protein
LSKLGAFSIVEIGDLPFYDQDVDAPQTSQFKWSESRITASSS